MHKGHTSLEHVERDLFVQGRLAQCIKDIHHWNMLRQIYLYRVGELNAISSDEWKYLRTVWVLFVIPKAQALQIYIYFLLLFLVFSSCIALQCKFLFSCCVCFSLRSIPDEGKFTSAHLIRYLHFYRKMVLNCFTFENICFLFNYFLYRHITTYIISNLHVFYPPYLIC